jgi:hypothetical protein
MKIIHEKKLCFDYGKLFLLIICLLFVFTIASLFFGSLLNLVWMVVFDRYDVDFIRIELFNMIYVICGCIMGLLFGLNCNKNLLYSEKIICKELKRNEK